MKYYKIVKIRTYDYNIYKRWWFFPFWDYIDRADSFPDARFKIKLYKKGLIK